MDQSVWQAYHTLALQPPQAPLQSPSWSTVMLSAPSLVLPAPTAAELPAPFPDLLCAICGTHASSCHPCNKSFVYIVINCLLWPPKGFSPSRETIVTQWLNEHREPLYCMITKVDPIWEVSFQISRRDFAYTFTNLVIEGQCLVALTNQL